MEEIMFQKTVSNIFISLQTNQLYWEMTVLKTKETRFVVSSKPAPKVFSVRKIISNFHEFC